MVAPIFGGDCLSTELCNYRSTTWSKGEISYFRVMFIAKYTEKTATSVFLDVSLLSWVCIFRKEQL